MSDRCPTPGVLRDERLGVDGLERLARQLERGTVPSAVVLTQWLTRYGEAARELLRRYGQYREALESPSRSAHRISPASRRCPRCGGAFSCFHTAIEQCPCRQVELSPAFSAVLAERYDGCLCGDCLRELTAADTATPQQPHQR